MKKLVLLTLVGILISWHAALAEENPCDGKKLTICEKNPEGNPICQILKPDATETVDSIIQFLRAIQSSFNEEEQEQLICARLMGRKRIEFLGNISSPLAWFSYVSDNLYHHADLGDNEITFHLPKDPLILQWIELEKKADRILPDYLFCPKNPKFRLVLQGDVTKLEKNDLASVRIWLTDVTMPDRKPIETRMQSLQQTINQYTKNLLNSGLDEQKMGRSSFVHDMRRDGKMLVGDVGFVPSLTSTSQLELLHFSTGVKKNPSVEQLLEEVYCKHPAQLGQRHAEWIQEHASETPNEFTEYSLLFPGTIWKDPDGSQLLIPCLRSKCCERKLDGVSYHYWEFELCKWADYLNGPGFRLLRFRE